MILRLERLKAACGTIDTYYTRSMTVNQHIRYQPEIPMSLQKILDTDDAAWLIESRP